MHLLIIEDEPPIANELAEFCQSLLGAEVESIGIKHTIASAEQYLADHRIDLCLLDLNLKGNNGFALLKSVVSGSFHTIIVSAHTEQAIEAFQYGVLDFVPKPVERNRLQQAFKRYFDILENTESHLKYLVVRKQKANYLIAIEEIICFQAEGYLVKIFLKEGKPEYIEKPLNRLIQILPKRFLHVHRSYIVALDQITSYHHKGGGVYEILLKNNTVIPLSPSMVKTLDRLTHRTV